MFPTAASKIAANNVLAIRFRFTLSAKTDRFLFMYTSPSSGRKPASESLARVLARIVLVAISYYADFGELDLLTERADPDRCSGGLRAAARRLIGNSESG